MTSRLLSTAVCTESSVSAGQPGSVRERKPGNRERKVGLDWPRLRKSASSIIKQALTWNPLGKRKRGKTQEHMAQDRGRRCHA